MYPGNSCPRKVHWRDFNISPLISKKEIFTLTILLMKNKKLSGQTIIYQLLSFIHRRIVQQSIFNGSILQDCEPLQVTCFYALWNHQKIRISYNSVQMSFISRREALLHWHWHITGYQHIVRYQLQKEKWFPWAHVKPCILYLFDNGYLNNSVHKEQET